MKKLLLSLAAVSALTAAAAPAFAQPHRGDYGRQEGGRAEMLEMRIERAAERHQISWREARNLRAELREVRQMEWRYSRDGRLSGWERADLDRRFDRVQALLRVERSDRDYGYGYGYRR